MAFTLKPVNPVKFNSFTATAGSKFTVGIEAEGGGDILLAASYNGVTISDPGPFTFTAVAAKKSLVLVYALTNLQTLVAIDELDGTKKQALGIRLGTSTKAFLVIN